MLQEVESIMLTHATINVNLILIVKISFLEHQHHFKEDVIHPRPDVILMKIVVIMAIMKNLMVLKWEAANLCTINL